jgi:hypothetical protein
MKKLILTLSLGFLISSCTVVARPGGAVIVDTPDRIVINPRVIYVPKYDIYIVDDDRIEVYRYKNRWYWYRGGVWYVAERYEGPWIILKGESPIKIPPGQIRKMEVHERNMDKKFFKELEKERKREEKEWKKGRWND